MGGGEDMRDFDATVRGAFDALVHELLPAEACLRGWPVASPDDFARVLLDHALGEPWETVLSAPVAAAAPALDLILAIEMGERLLEGAACVASLDRRSLEMRRGAAPDASPSHQPCQFSARAGARRG